MPKKNLDYAMELSAIVITKNEEKNIFDCLNSLSFVSEIILVDSGSTDKTLEIAKTFLNVKIIVTEWFGYVRNKEIAIEHAKHDWIFWIDADEVVTPELRNEWLNFSKSNLHLNYAAADLPRLTFFLGHPVRHSGWYPDKVTRFFNKKKTKFNQTSVHECIILSPSEKKYSFKSDLWHYSYRNLYQYFYKMNQYGKHGGYEVYKRKGQIHFIRLIYQPFWTFFRLYFLKRGFLDGRIGFIVCCGGAFSNFIKYCYAYFQPNKNIL